MERELTARSYRPDLNNVDVFFPISEEQSMINGTPHEELLVGENVIIKEHAPEKQAWY